MAVQPWFEDAELGIFVHWGIYAVDGVQESWSFYDDIVPHDRYMSRRIKPPTASDLDPHATVLAVELEGELELYRGAGAASDIARLTHDSGAGMPPVVGRPAP